MVPIFFVVVEVSTDDILLSLTIQPSNSTLSQHIAYDDLHGVFCIQWYALEQGPQKCHWNRVIEKSNTRYFKE